MIHVPYRSVVLLTGKLCFHFSKINVGSQSSGLGKFKSSSLLPVPLRSLCIGFYLQERESLRMYHGLPLNPTRKTVSVETVAEASRK